MTDLRRGVGVFACILLFPLFAVAQDPDTRPKTSWSHLKWPQARHSSSKTAASVTAQTLVARAVLT